MGNNSKFNKKYIHWRLDYDYWDKLTPKEKEWLNKFNSEYYQNSFYHEDPVHKLDAPVEFTTKTGKKKKGTKKQELMRDTNARKYDIATSLPQDNSPMIRPNQNRYSAYDYKLTCENLPDTIEDLIIEYIDESLKFTKDFKEYVDRILNKTFN